MNVKWNYEDIVELPHHVSKTRPQMDRQNRAAQFSPFAALTGYEDAVAEEARLTEARIELTDGRMAEINERLVLLREHEGEHPAVTICYYRQDERKAGGAYLTVSDTVRRLDEYERKIILYNGTVICLNDILDIVIHLPGR